MYDHATKIFFLTAIAITLLLIISLILLLDHNFKKKIRYRREQQLLVAQFNKEVILTQLEIQEQTRQHISEQIHDNIGQTLSLAKLNLHTISEDDENALDKISYTKNLVTKAIEDCGNLVKALSSHTIGKGGLLKAVEFELEKLERNGSLKTVLEITGKPQKLDSRTELILFRIIQEAIINTTRHAKASMVKLQLEYKPYEFALQFEDDGKGFEVVDHTIIEPSTGLYKMYNRAKMLGAIFNITSTSKGTIIVLTLPVENQASISTA